MASRTRRSCIYVLAGTNGAGKSSIAGAMFRQSGSVRLEQAMAAGIDVRIWFVGLRSPELHIARVRARVARGGHNIPEAKIRERYDRSRLNLIALMPRLTELRVFDNSIDADPEAGRLPQPTLILHLAKRRIVSMIELSRIPDWAKAVVAAAVKIAE